MIVLGVDAGVTTGLAIVSGDDQRVLYHSASTIEDLPSTLEMVVPTVDEVVVERALAYKTSRLGKQLDLVHKIIDRHCVGTDTHWVDASSWKNTDARKYPVPKGVTAHERDAIRVARWFCHTRESRLVGKSILAG